MSERSSSQSLSLLPSFFGVAVALLACAALIIVGLLGRPAGGLNVPRGSQVVHVDETEYGFHISAGSLRSGNVIVIDRNLGTIPHELVMFKTANAHARLPLRKDGSLDEESPAIEAVADSGSSLAPGETRVLGANLDPGSYVIVCNLPAHYRLGMHQTITVK
jgi:uncharacterized cupredoxin-like copper-binding protein